MLKITKLQEQIRMQWGMPFSLHYSKGHSNTTRSKTYKNGCHALACGALNEVISIDADRQIAHVEPRVTMDQLVRATLVHGLIPLVVPEFKGITVGGAIMGAAAESSSHRWGIFHDTCAQLSFLNGKGELVTASPTENADLFYGLSGSYGAFGLLVSAVVKLMPALKSVHLKYHYFKDPLHALAKMKQTQADFVDGMIFDKNDAVIVEGSLSQKSSARPSLAWYAQKVKSRESEQIMPVYDYLFRYDRGAFWMGNYLFSLPFLSRYISQGLLKKVPPLDHFTHHEVETFKEITFPRYSLQSLARPLMSSQRLWKLLHKAEKWVQDRLIIQDFCIPKPQSEEFLTLILKDPATYPIWLCPLKGTATPQFLAPHVDHPEFINFGIYGLPSYSAPMRQITQNLEQKTQAFTGRKVLYSRSYYDTETFWKIYPRAAYEKLREKTHAAGVWRDLTDKVLSE